MIILKKQRILSLTFIALPWLQEVTSNFLGQTKTIISLLQPNLWPPNLEGW